jgi:hypothetical protein
MKKSYWIGGIVIVLLIIIICFGAGHFNSSGSSSTPAASAQTSSGTSFTQNNLVSSEVSVDACSYLSAADVASTLGSETDAIQTQMLSPAVCQYQSGTANDVSVVAMVTSINYNSATIDQEVYNQALKVGALPLAGIGDMAAEQTLADGSAVSVFKNGNYVQVEVDASQSDSMLKAKDLAQIAVSKM